MKTKSLFKKCAVIFILFLGVIGATNLNAQETFTVGDLNYQINDDGISVTVIGHVDGWNAAGELNIPESVNYSGNDYAVTIIGEYAFDECSSLTGSLIIPNSVIIIGAGAFNNCYGFYGSLVIPNSVQIIYYWAFQNCYGLTDSLIIPNSVTTIGTSAFSRCHFTSLSIPSSLTYIQEGAFYSCNMIEEITVDEDNPVYDSRENCNAIILTNENKIVFGCRNTIIPNTVNAIGELSFVFCNIFHVIIPNTVTNIESNPFYGCPLESIIVEEGNTVYDSRNNCNAIIKTDSNELVTGCKYTIIPNNICSIGEEAFYLIELSGELVLPNSIISIGHFAFYGTNISGSLIIPNSVISIGVAAFAFCYDLTDTLTIGNSVEMIDDNAFADTRFSAVTTLATTPPSFAEGSYIGFENCDIITVPCGCIPAYQNSDWSQYFTTFIEDCSDVSELHEDIASVYPNPTNGILKIQAENIQMVSVFDMSGAVVFESSASGDEFEYDFSNNESGVYLVRIGTSQGIFSKRITVM